MKTFVLFLLLAGWYTFAIAQRQQIHGNIKNKEGKGIAYASVMIINERRHIVGFEASDEEGHFILLLPDTWRLQQLWLEVRRLGYKTASTIITDPKKSYPVTMEEQAIDLSQVEVKSRPRIERRGDTLSYEVSAFAKNEDRSIGDVLKRMPGIEVNDKGEIKFNGKSLSHFYIDGDDLLDDRYSIGSKTIPHNMVKGIEIMQNHQRVKVLQHQIRSDDVALNLIIKDEAKLKASGQGKIGLGLQQYDGELNTILFNKKYKMLNVVKANNIGEDLSADFTAFNQSPFLASMENTPPATLLSSSTASAPDLPKNRYYFNYSESLNANNLVNLKSGLQLKSTINMLLDRNQMEYVSFNNLYLEDDTVHYSEEQKITGASFLMNVNLSAEANKDQYYLRNRLLFTYKGDLVHSALRSNEFALQQKLKGTVGDFSNHLEYIPVLKNKNIIRTEWYINYYSSPQRLQVSPGINEQVLNRGSAYAQAEQKVETPSWFTKISLAYSVLGRIKQHYRIGLFTEARQLESALRLQQLDGQISNFEESDDNNLSWMRNRLYTSATYDYKRGRFETSLSLPLAWQNIRYRDAGFQLDTRKSQLFFNPSLTLKVMTTTEDFMSLNYGYKNQTGDLNGVYRGVILLNYRHLQSNDAALQEQHSHQAGITYHFQRSIEMLYWHGGLSWSKTTANAILSSQVTNNIVQAVLIPLANDVSTFSGYGGLSKYIFALGATAAIKVSWNSSRFNQLLNNRLFPYTNNTFTVSPSMEVRLWNAISLSYNATGSWLKSKAAANEAVVSLPEQQIKIYDQSIRLLFTPYKDLFITVTGRHQLRQQQQQNQNYFFADAGMRYRIGKWRSDIEMNLINLANIKSYETYNISGNAFYYSHYSLRGRMAVVKYSFNF